MTNFNLSLLVDKRIIFATDKTKDTMIHDRDSDDNKATTTLIPTRIHNRASSSVECHPVMPPL